LQERVGYRAVVRRDGIDRQVDAADLVPGDVVRLRSGAVVAADLRLLSADGMAWDESVLTGESALPEVAPHPLRTAYRAAWWP
jgi:P-type E1-E2 ATPase